MTTILPLPAHGDRPPAVCIVGFSNSGKTTVTVGLVSALTWRGFRAGTIRLACRGHAYYEIQEGLF